MNQEQIETLTRWMERAMEENIRLQARIAATDLVVSCLMERLPDPGELLDHLKGMQAALQDSRGDQAEMSQLVADFLDNPIEYLEGSLEPVLPASG